MLCWADQSRYSWVKPGNLFSQRTCLYVSYDGIKNYLDTSVWTGGISVEVVWFPFLRTVIYLTQSKYPVMQSVKTTWWTGVTWCSLMQTRLHKLMNAPHNCFSLVLHYGSGKYLTLEFLFHFVFLLALNHDIHIAALNICKQPLSSSLLSHLIYQKISALLSSYFHVIRNQCFGS